VTLIVVAVARELLERRLQISVHLLDLFVPLLGSLALMRILFYALRRVFATGSALQTFERTFGTIIWLGFALYVVGALPDVIAALDSIAIKVGRQAISLWVVLQAIFWTLVTLLAALWLGSAVEARLMRAPALDYNLRVVLSRVSKALLVVVALLIVLPIVGIERTVLSVFGGALGVGLGFGLQKVASNYVSGFIILLERSVKIGDIVTVDNFHGKVAAITSRYTLLQAQDGREAIVPNETFIITTVLNHTHSDLKVRLANPVSVAYGTDLDRVMSILRDAALGHRRVLRDPEPAAVVLRFGDNGIDLELGFWISDPDAGTGNVRSEIYVAMWRALRDAGVEIPYPQRVVRMHEERVPTSR
jgi:small-conductance mechanosensitive channel